MRFFSKTPKTNREVEASQLLEAAGEHSRELAQKVEDRLSNPLDALDKKIDKYLRKQKGVQSDSMATPSDIKRAGER